MSARPQPSDPFEWVQVNGRPALVCGRLLTIAPHVFTTRAWPLGAPRAAHDDRAWDSVAAALDVDPARLVRVRQVHGAAVMNAALPHAAPPDADIVICQDASRAVAVQAADCVPLLLADRATGAVAAAHAGWRGLAQRVPARAVQALCEQFGGSPETVYAAAGPSIGACCYEVGADVREAFAESGASEEQLTAWFRAEPVQDARNPTKAGVTRRRDHWYFDGWAATRAQLVEAGVRDEHVFAAHVCTASHAGIFSSYRGEGLAAGRIAAAIRPAPRS